MPSPGWTVGLYLMSDDGAFDNRELAFDESIWETHDEAEISGLRLLNYESIAKPRQRRSLPFRVAVTWCFPD